MFGFVAESIAEVLAERVGNTVRQRRAARLFRRTGIVECALRAVDGEVAGFDESWVYGRGVVSRSKVIFSEAGGSVESDLIIVGLDESDLRLSQMRDGHVVVRLLTVAGVLEWDLFAAVLDLAAGFLDTPTERSALP